MANTRFCAFNKTRGIILSLDVAVLDAAMDPLRVLRVLMEGLSSESTTGLWLTHFRSVPVARAVTPFDLVYLDENHCVVHAVSLTVDSGYEPFDGETASALVLPVATIDFSKTERGDQMVVVAAPETARNDEPAVEPMTAPTPIRAAAMTANAETAAEEPDSMLARYMSGRAHEAPEAAPRLSMPTTIEPERPAARRELAEPVTEPASAQILEATAPASTTTTIEYYRESLPTLRTRVRRWLRIERPAAPEPAHRRLDRRRAFRLSKPGLVAYFFTGGAPRPHRIENISVTGFLMQTTDVWIPGTVIRMTLQKMGTRGDQPGDAITVHSRLVRSVPGGGAFEFVLSGFLDRPYRRAVS